MSSRPPITDQDIHAFVDGELDDSRSEYIRFVMQNDKDLEGRIAAYRADREHLSRAYKHLEARPLPESWINAIESKKHRRTQTGWKSTAYALAASIAVILIGWSALQYWADGDPDTMLLAAAMQAYTDTSNAGAEVRQTIAGDDLNNILTSGFASPVNAPDLSAMGYILSSASLYPDVMGAQGVALDYRDMNNRSVVVFLHDSPGHARFEMTKRGQTRLCIWQDDILSTIMIGDMPAGEMLRLASLAYNGLNS